MSGPALGGRIVGVQVGLPKDHGDWRTAFFKEPVRGPIVLHPLGLEGDGQADRRVHGGLDKAVLVYSADHYETWWEELAQPDLPFGAFGENLTVQGLDETSVCIGDVFRVGDALVQVWQRRGPCWKIGRRWGRPDLVARVARTGRTGWYVRVVEPGRLEVGRDMSLVSRPFPAWVVASMGMNPRRARSS